MATILVIDDERAIRALLKTALTRFGHQVKTADTASKGIEMFDDDCFDMVITDIRMPGLSGDFVIEHIRNSNRQSVPVIGISGTPHLLPQKDFDVVLPKPFSLNDLKSSVNHLTRSLCN